MKPINIMISSRCVTKIGNKDLTQIRKEIKEQLQSFKIASKQIFEVWINEDASEDCSKDCWDVCLKRVDEADIVLVLYTGETGWTIETNDIGICHAELDRAIIGGSSRVGILKIDHLLKKKPNSKADSIFQNWIEKIQSFKTVCKSQDEIVDKAEKATAHLMVELTKSGKKLIKKDRYSTGPALDWSHLDFTRRKKAIEECLLKALGINKNGELSQWGHKPIYVKVHAIPDSFALPEARELVGKPFLNDYQLFSKDLATGPVHIIGIHKGMTESQALSYLGHPNVFIAKPGFGYYIVDRIDHSQLIIITNCRDETSTVHGAQRCRDWLRSTGEIDRLTTIAAKRKKVLKTIAANVDVA